ncbi:hypothetical protein G3N56_02785 [Desulfovibrio sulfodismutans]|uniref:Uncharacterized protein n=1 Tax=Desulfolutivibrio sulfodismutans TaxID=63561 RepID=A0A7K3NHV1_9BACT|nr:hypothetical protein [Desulfolutivibrio sulfodismutans]NDY55667.1 hypothetical protein [Desulfolutivibrio sulfodismutans]QLA13694.1 hypothetical protein GD606_16215 [Desulfolutivibrio sulfodismutans DSM 3696]
MIDKETNQLFDEILSINSSLITTNQLLTKKFNIVTIAINTVISSDSNYTSICKYSYKHILPQLKESVDRLRMRNNVETNLERIYFCLTAMVKEKIIRTKSSNPEEAQIISYYDEHELTPKEKEYKFILGNIFVPYSLDDSFEEFDQRSDNAQKEYQKFIADLTSWKAKIDDYEKRLQEFHSQCTLLGLSKAFLDLLKRKKFNLVTTLITLIALAAAIIAIPALKLYLSLGGSPFFPFELTTERINSSAEFAMLIYIVKHILPLIVFEIILIYYFRIILQQYYSLKGQILQLEYRNAICAFIEDHGKFREEHPKINFDKFDSLIFSPIVPQPDKIPTTFDGIEQIMSLIKEFKAK